jgi:hypothetical protein
MTTTIAISTQAAGGGTLTRTLSFSDDTKAQAALRAFAAATGLDVGTATPAQILEHVLRAWVGMARNQGLDYRLRQERVAATVTVQDELGLDDEVAG